MASNSIREQILTQTAIVLAAITAVGSVKRKVVASLNELKETPFPLFPIIYMTAGLPVPLHGGYVTLRESGDSANLRSILEISLRTYGLDKSSPDTAISTLAEDIWAKLYDDPTVNSLAEGVTVKLQRETTFFEPFYRFDILYEVEYIHDTDNL
jgi:hypothetical protein